jgi:hypothetical protein
MNGECLEKTLQEIPNGTKICSVIRDPIKRLVSGYMTRRASFYKQTSDIEKWAVNVMNDDEPYNYSNFREFICDLIKIDQYKVNVHFTPQYILINEHVPKFTYNIEFIDELVGDMKRMGLKGQFPHEHERANEMSKHIYEKLLHDKKLLHKITLYYQVDYEHLSDYF